MIRLNLAAGPVWLALAAGVRVLVSPCTSAVMMAARNDAEVEDLPEDSSNEQRALAFAKAIARITIIEWEGVGDLDGEPLLPTRDNIGLLLDVYPIFERFQLDYVAKGLALESEKNDSAPALNGTSAGATPIAAPAQASAPSARAASTSPKRSKAGKSGT